MNKKIPIHQLEKDYPRKKFQSNLLSWFDLSQRNLPWRSHPNLYKTVVSEFMLQQTRVSTVLPYFTKWIKKFPNFKSLANSNEETILKYWEGLGYYSRARNLHKLAKIISSFHSPPTSIEDWQKLPGVGPYISAAITSIAFEKKHAVCDGNVVRVLTRNFAIDIKFSDGASAQRKLQPLAQQIISNQRPGDYNQAIMELGATICHKHNPTCTLCPIKTFCVSGKRGNPESFPIISKKKKKKKSVERFWVQSTKGILLQKANINSTKLSGIYELPGANDEKLFDKGNIICERKRTIGMVDYNESIFHAEANSEERLKSYSMEWIHWEEIDKITISGPHRRWINEIKKLID